ncbi:MAG: hypothetical protein PHZ28_00340 [Candidatus Izemoplasmatales bacterium]|nr:hypothetical protein [Candidatus Izemoplasmatales bacterium]
MKKMILIAFISIFLIGCNFQGSTTTLPVTTVDTTNYIEIMTVEDLKNMEMNKSYILMADLDLQDENWVPIGTFKEPYLGNFDGNSHIISNLTISDDYQYNGLFGYAKGEVKNLEIKDFNIEYEAKLLSYAGGLAGRISGKVDNVLVTGNITVENTRGNTYVGLLVGMAEKSDDSLLIQDFIPVILKNNKATGSIEVIGEKMVFAGGLIGKSYNSRVYDNQTSATIDVKAISGLSAIGGLVGHNYSGLATGYETERIALNIAIYNNIVKTTIIAETGINQAYVGGLLGYDYLGYLYDNFSSASISLNGSKNNGGLMIGEDWRGRIESSVATGEISLVTVEDATDNIATLIGLSYNHELIESCFWHSENSGFTVDSDNVTMSDLKSLPWYEANLADWDQDFIAMVIALLE